MALEKILKPYRLFLPPVLHERYGESVSFSNKTKTLAFIKQAQKIDPTFNPPVYTARNRYFDTITGKLFPDRRAYEKERDRVRELMATQAA